MYQLIKELCEHFADLVGITDMAAYWIFNCLVALVLSIFFAGIAIPQILLIAFRRKLFDVPNERKIHTSAVPRLGGLAFMPVVFFVISFLLGIGIKYSPRVVLPLLEGIAPELTFSFCALLLIYVVGMADDFIGVKYRAKFVTQIICSGLIIASGIWLSSFHGLLGVDEVSPWLGYPFTVVVIVFIINAINLIDGIDGLASGLMSVTLFIYAVVFFVAGWYFYAAVATATLGVLIPFFYYNVFGNPEKQKKIFMGDTGALTIGILISIMSMRLLRSPRYYIDANMFVVAFSPLIVPCFDVLRVYFTRIYHKRNPFMPDKSHIHHMLLDLGWSQRRCMCSIIMVSLMFTVVNVCLSYYIDINVLLVTDFAVWFAALYFIRKAITKVKRRRKAESAA